MPDVELNLDAGPGYLDPGLKVGWAKHHLRALDEEIRQFVDSKPHSVRFEDDVEAGEYVMYLSIGTLPVTIGLIAGDFFSCLRGALDHLATKLTMAPGGTYNHRASFPVLDVWDGDTSRSFDRAVKGIPIEAIEVIRSLQPYHSGKLYKASKLWQLHRLWNIDKHRRIPLHATGGELQIRHPSHMQPVSSRTDDGGVMRFPLAAKGKVYFNPAVKVVVEFGDKHEGVIVRADELIDIHNFVRNDVLPRFTRFF